MSMHGIVSKSILHGNAASQICLAATITDQFTTMLLEHAPVVAVEGHGLQAAAEGLRASYHCAQENRSVGAQALAAASQTRALHLLGAFHRQHAAHHRIETGLVEVV